MATNLNAPVSVIIPARNEAATIKRVIARVSELAGVDEVVVADNGSDDGTGNEAREAGATVVTESRPGMGHAVRAGMIAAHNDWVMKVDADLDRFDVDRFADMMAARAEGVGLVKGNWNDPDDDMPMTRLLVRPAVSQLAAGLSHLQAPNSGIYLADRRCFAVSELVGSYAVDIDVMLRVYAFGASVAEVPIGTLAHDRRHVGHYNNMADEIMAFFLERAAQNITQEVLVLMGGQGNIPPTCQNLLIARARTGGRVRIDAGMETAFKDLPSAQIGLIDTKTFTPASSSTGLSIWVPQNATEQVLNTAHQIATAAKIPATVLEMQESGEADHSIEMVIGTDVARGFFRRLA